MKYLYFFLLIFLLYNTVFGTNYDVGPGRTYATVSDVRWEALQAGDSVLIYWQAAPYKDKWVICRVGEKDKPIVIKGIPNEEGNLPVIDGNGAVTRKELNFWNEVRGVIKIGGANKPADVMPANIIIENLDIRSGRPPYSFTGRDGFTKYENNCAAIFIEKGENITIRNCFLHDCGNGLFAAHASKNVLVEANYIYDNGIEGDYLEHNNYTEADGITFQFNRFGPLRKQCDGNNLKDRSKGTIIRYNWLEGGNRQLDLVDSGSPDFYNNEKYHSTYVYGNILIEYDDNGNNQLVHYGGDSGDKTKYRKGTLYFYHNTVISYRTGNTTLVRLSSDGENADIRNNIVYLPEKSGKLGILADAGGNINLINNFLKPGWVNSHSSTSGKILPSGNIEGNDPGFIKHDSLHFDLLSSSQCINAGSALLPEEEIYKPLFEYKPHMEFSQRIDIDRPDLGAYADIPYSINHESTNLLVFPSIFSDECTITGKEGWDVKIMDVFGNNIDFTESQQIKEIPELKWKPKNNLSQGTYFIIFSKGDERKVFKVCFVK